MTKKTGFNFMKIVLCFSLGTMLFAFQSCNRNRSSPDRSGSLGISTDDVLPS